MVLFSLEATNLDHEIPFRETITHYIPLPISWHFKESRWRFPFRPETQHKFKWSFSKYILSLNRPFGTQLFTKSISKLFLSWHRGSIGWGFSNEIWQTFLVPWQQVDIFRFFTKGSGASISHSAKRSRGQLALPCTDRLREVLKKLLGNWVTTFFGAATPNQRMPEYLQNLATGVKCNSYLGWFNLEGDFAIKKMFGLATKAKTSDIASFAPESPKMNWGRVFPLRLFPSRSMESPKNCTAANREFL